MNIATRAAGLDRLAAFTPHMGQDYAQLRNFDLGAHSAVSRLSPYLRRRVLTEAEVIAAALEAHGAQQAAKFIDEVIWRSYFKGWLELHPGVWRDYADGIAADRAGLSDRQQQLYVAVRQGDSGIGCMDLWVSELICTGYLHNHARLWFSSIWVFVLGLPWRLGAEFFLQHLLDGDPASNTLGWRWVAGLHTRGKCYHAEAGNIATFTQGRLCPDAAQLAPRHPLPSEREAVSTPAPLRHLQPPDPGLPSLLLITEEDCCLRPCDLPVPDIRATIALNASHLRSADAVSLRVAQFEAGVLADALARLGSAEAIILPAGGAENLIAQARAVGAVQIVTAYVPIGPLRDGLLAAMPQLTAAGLTLAEWRRPWDEMIWPDCTAGFFKVKKQIPRYLLVAGLRTAAPAEKEMP
jgi:deoxyribodipyrimidine photo-lyase